MTTASELQAAELLASSGARETKAPRPMSEDGSRPLTASEIQVRALMAADEPEETEEGAEALREHRELRKRRRDFRARASALRREADELGIEL